MDESSSHATSKKNKFWREKIKSHNPIVEVCLWQLSFRLVWGMKVSTENSYLVKICPGSRVRHLT